MNEFTEMNYKKVENINQLKHLKFEKIKDKHIAILIDSTAHEIVRGYGDNQLEAINDLHSNLI
jgi:hypothetical protein